MTKSSATSIKICLVLCVCLLLTSCDTSITMFIKLSSIKTETMTTVMVSSSNGKCPRGLVEFECVGGVFTSKVPVITVSNLSRLKSQQFGLFHGDGGNLIIFINKNFLDGVRKQMQLDRFRIGPVTANVHNDTNKSFSIGVSGVWLEGVGAVGKQIEIYHMPPDSKISIRLSDTGTTALFNNGAEPVATIIQSS